MFLPYCDSGVRANDFSINVLDCLQAIEFAYKKRWFSARFNTTTYFKLSKVDEGDLNWIIPGKILAMSSPASNDRDGLKPRFFLNLFKFNKVASVVRLNERMYKDEEF